MIFYLVIIGYFSMPLVACQSDIEVPEPPAELKNIPLPPVNTEENEVDASQMERNINYTAPLDDIKGVC